MVAAATENTGTILRGGKPEKEASWQAVCLADFGDGDVMFVAKPQIPPRNVNWIVEGKWVHGAKPPLRKYSLAE